jgi:methylglutaconyl-CoA hydratase
MNYSRIIASAQEAVATVTLNRPEVHNAFDETVIAELTDAFTRLSETPEVRAIVLRGAGASFCAGADLAYMGKMADYSQAENIADAQAIQQMFAAIARCPKVTVARVQGAAIGGGAGLVAVCDIAIAAEEATFALSEVRLGLVPAIIGPYILEKVGMGAARALFVSGARFGASDALRIGLVQQVAPLADLDAAVQKQTDLIRQAGPEAVRAAKRLLRDIAGKTPEEAAAVTVECIANLRVSPEGQEGIRAFLEKRTPDFKKGQP